MAKDGTLRGKTKHEAKVANPPKKLTERIIEGTAKKSEVLDYGEGEDEEIEDPGEYLDTVQKGKKPFLAGKIYRDTSEWLKDRGVIRHVNPKLIEQYSISMARFIQAEEMISRKGMIGKHPTTQADTISPYISSSEKYNKLALAAWGQIAAIIDQNCTVAYGSTPHGDAMEAILSIKKERNA